MTATTRTRICGVASRLALITAGDAAVFAVVDNPLRSLALAVLFTVLIAASYLLGRVDGAR